MKTPQELRAIALKRNQEIRDEANKAMIPRLESYIERCTNDGYTVAYIELRYRESASEAEKYFKDRGFLVKNKHNGHLTVSWNEDVKTGFAGWWQRFILG